MLAEWLQRLRALAAEIESQNTASLPPAPGQDATDASESATPTDPTNGSQEVTAAVQKIPEIDMRDILIAKTKRALDEAAQLHLQALYGSEGAGVLIDWVLMGETVDADLDNESDKHSLYVATSSDMTSWKMVGFASALGRYVYSGIA